MKKKQFLHLFIIFLLLVALLVFLFVFILKQSFRISNFDDKIEIGYKQKYKRNFSVCFGNGIKCIKLKPSIDGEVNTSKLGKYKIKYKYIFKNKSLVLTQNIIVVDKEAHKIEIESAVVCPNEKKYDVKYKIIDNYDGDITKLGKISYKDKRISIDVKDSNNNISSLSKIADIEDKEAPIISLNGNKTIYIMVNDSYEDEGVTVSDNCDEHLEVKTDNNINNSVPGSYKITYTVTDSSNNTSSVERIVNVYNVVNGERTVYLTFDDGPSEHTSRLLDILGKYNVKATFFVTGNGSDEMILREYQEGHSIGLHTNTHEYSYIYSSVDNYFDDLNAVRYRVKRITGYESNLIRFPGGSSNTVSMNYDGGIHIMSILTDEVSKRGFYYYDWNVLSGDAGETENTDEVYNNVISTLKEGNSIVLQHDTKGFSVDAVEKIIQYCLNN